MVPILLFYVTYYSFPGSLLFLFDCFSVNMGLSPLEMSLSTLLYIWSVVPRSKYKADGKLDGFMGLCIGVWFDVGHGWSALTLILKHLNWVFGNEYCTLF